MTVRPMSREAFLRTLEEEMRDARVHGWSEEEIRLTVELAAKAVPVGMEDVFLSRFYQSKALLAQSRVGS